MNGKTMMGFTVGDFVACDGVRIGGDGPIGVRHVRVAGFTPQRVQIHIVLNNGMTYRRTLSPKRLSLPPDSDERQ